MDRGAWVHAEGRRVGIPGKLGQAQKFCFHLGPRVYTIGPHRNLAGGLISLNQWDLMQ